MSLHRFQKSEKPRIQNQKQVMNADVAWAQIICP